MKLGGFVNAAGDFTDIPKVVNGCSDLMVEIFGDKGRHARAAVACPVLPMGAAVEVDAVVEAMGGRGACVVEDGDLCGEKRAVEPIGNGEGGDGGDDEPE